MEWKWVCGIGNLYICCNAGKKMFFVRFSIEASHFDARFSDLHVFFFYERSYYYYLKREV